MHIPLMSQGNFPLDLEGADSLENILPSKSGNEKVDVLNSISYALIRHYSNRSDSMASLSIQLARELNYKKGLAKALFCKGTNDYINGDFIESLTALYDALNLYKEIPDTNMIIETFYQIGAVSFFSLTDLEEGLHCVQTCLDYAKSSGYMHWESQMYSSFQYLYSTSGDHEAALKYLKLYTSFAAEMSVPRLEEAMVIAAYGRTYSQMGEHRKALNQYLITWPRIEPDDVEERAYLAQLTYSIGREYSALGLTDSSLYYFSHGMMLAKKNKHYWGSMMNSFGLAKQYLMMHELDKCESYCDSAIYFGSQIDSLSSFYGIKEYSRLLGMSGELYQPMNKPFKRFLAWRVMSGAYQMLIQIKEQQGNYKEVYLISKSFEGVQDSIANFQKRTEILDLQYRYQSQHKDDQITLLSQENQLQSFKISRSRLLLFTVIAISILLLLILILFLRQNRIKSGRKVAEFKQRLLRSQMNPHFIFNSLTSVQNLILQKDEIKASVYLSRFSDLVRNILNNSQADLISLEEEISTVENYIELQKIRFPEKFDYIIKVDELLNPENINVPPMLVQPFIENAIEHAFKRLETKGHITLNILKKNDSFLIEIIDNGIGRQNAQELRNHLEKDHKPMATLITKERIKTMNKKLKKEINFEIIDLKDNSGKAAGTKVVFDLPLSLSR